MNDVTAIKNKNSRLSQFFHRRSLTICLLTLPFSLLVLGYVPEYAFRYHQQGSTFLLRASGTALIATIICGAALINLMRDVERNYSPQRCSLASVILLLAFAPVPVLVYKIFHYI